MVSSRDDPYFPSQVALVGADGKTISEYWHSGHLDRMAIMDREHGRPKILLGGVSNGYRQATLVVLDPDAIKGASVELARPEIQIHGFGNAQEHKRLLFPRSCVNLTKDMYNHVEELTATWAAARVAVVECPDRPRCQVWYEFDAALRLASVMPDDQLIAMHNALYAQRQINHSFSVSEERAFEQIRCLSGCE